MSGSQILQPSVSIAVQNADVAAQNTAQKVLLVGQITSAGSAADGVLIENVASVNDSTDASFGEDALFGEDSMLAEMVRAFRRVNQLGRIDCIPLDDAAGTARIVDMIFTGTSTAAGTITITAGSELLYTYAVAIPSGTAAAAVPALLVTAINADTKCPFTAADETSGELSLTAVNLGTVANDLGVEVVIDATGLTLSQNVTEDTAGATDPTLTGVLDVATKRYQGIVWPYADETVLATFLAARYNPTNTLLDGVGFITIQDSNANAVATLAALNDRNLVFFVDKPESEVTGTVTGYLGPAQNEASYVKSSIFAAVRALRLTADASISRLLTSSASLDSFGGAALASLPYFNTPLADLPAIRSGRGWTDTEIEALFDAGGSVMGMNFTGTSALVGEVVTTYKTDASSNADPTFQFLNYVDTASNIREYFFNNYKARFAQTRLTEGAVSRGRDMANGTVVRAYTEQLYLDLAGPDFVLVQGGETAIEFFKRNLSIVLDLATGKVTITMRVPIVTQLREIVATMQIAFSTT